MKINWHRLLSLGILEASESARAKQIGQCFDFTMLLVMFWLPFQWYLEAKHQIDTDFVLTANWIIWGLFSLEAVVMTLLVKHKISYLISNWLNLFIVIAVFPPWWVAGSTYLAFLRYLRLIVLLRLLLPQIYRLHNILLRNRFGTTLFVFLIVTLLSGVIVSYIDPGVGSPWQGSWWAWQTVTTVGYGDAIPDTAVGKIFATILMLIGVGLVSLVSANLAAHFIERSRQQAKKPEKAVEKQFKALEARLQNVEQCNNRVEELLKKLIAENHSKRPD